MNERDRNGQKGGGTRRRGCQRPGQLDLADIRSDHSRHRYRDRRLDGLQSGVGGRRVGAPEVVPVPCQRRPQSQDPGRSVAHRHHMSRLVHHHQLHVQVRVDLFEITSAVVVIVVFNLILYHYLFKCVYTHFFLFNTKYCITF